MLQKLYDFLPYGILILSIAFIVLSIMFSNHIIEKEKAQTILKQSRNSEIIGTVAFSCMFIYTHIYLYPVLGSVYIKFNYPIPGLLKIASHSIFIVIPFMLLVALYIYFSKSIDKEFEENLQKYKDETKIRIRDLIGKRFKVLRYVGLGVPAVVLLLFVVLSFFQMMHMISNFLQK